MKDFVIICENHRNAYIQSISVGSAPSEPHIFQPKPNQKFILFLMPHSGPHFSTFLRVLMPKHSILGSPWRPAGSQNGIQNRSSIAKRLKTNDQGTHFFWYWKTTCFQYHFWSVPGHHFGRLGMDFGWILMDFGIIFQCISDFFAIRFVAFQIRSNKINQTNARHKSPCAICHDGAQIACPQRR